jgi:hypothetical protein
MKSPSVVHLEERTARLTILIDPRKKAVFERLCAREDLTSSQVIRRMIRSYIEERLERPWVPGEEGAVAQSRHGGAQRQQASELANLSAMNSVPLRVVLAGAAV